jgi:hypothetical protein
MMNSRGFNSFAIAFTVSGITRLVHTKLGNQMKVTVHGSTSHDAAIS